MKANIETLLVDAARQGLLAVGRLYSKDQLLATFTETGLDERSTIHAFSLVREAAKTGKPIGAIGIDAAGERRGRKYSFVGLPDPESTTRINTAPESSSERPGVQRELATELVAGPGASLKPGKLQIHFGDNLPILRSLPSSSFDLIYIDPPFNTGKAQSRTRIQTVRDNEGGDRTGFQGKRYRTVQLGSSSFEDAFDDFMGFLGPRLEEAKRLLKPNGSFFLHIDYREVHYCKVLLDNFFGRESFINEIIWAYDYGARSKKKWSTKHDNILWYAKDPSNYTFNFDEMERIPYMAPGLVGAEKAARGKTPTDVWWHTIVPTNGKERTGYPTQKPIGILNRLLKVHSLPGNLILDFFAGSGTTGEAAIRLGRSCTLIDNNEEALKVMERRLAFATPTFHGWEKDRSATEVRQEAAQLPSGKEEMSVHESDESTELRQQDLFGQST